VYKFTPIRFTASTSGYSDHSLTLDVRPINNKRTNTTEWTERMAEWDTEKNESCPTLLWSSTDRKQTDCVSTWSTQLSPPNLVEQFSEYIHFLIFNSIYISFQYSLGWIKSFERYVNERTVSERACDATIFSPSQLISILCSYVFFFNSKSLYSATAVADVVSQVGLACLPDACKQAKDNRDTSSATTK